MTDYPLVDDECFDRTEPASPDQLESLHTAIEEATEIKGAIEQIEEDLKAARDRLFLLERVRIPEQMAMLGLEKLTRKGWDVKLDLYVDGNIPKRDLEKRAAAFAYLEEIGADGLIKTKVVLEYGRGELDHAQRTVALLAKYGEQASLDRDVHAQTLHAFCREAIRDGRSDFDPERLGVKTGQCAKFSPVKAKKA